MSKNTFQERIKLWASRSVIYFILSFFAFVMLFPLTYMVIASFKTTTDFSDSPRRLLPYSPVTTDYNGQAVNLFRFEFEGQDVDFVTAAVHDKNNDKINFGYLTTVESLENAVTQGKHSTERRNAETYFIFPLERLDDSDTIVDFEEETRIFSPRHTELLLQETVGDVIYNTYTVALDDADSLSILLGESDIRVPLVAYAAPTIQSLIDDEEFSLSYTGEIEIEDGEGSTREYPTYDLSIGENTYSYVLAHNSQFVVMVEPDNESQVVYAPESVLDAVEKVEFQTSNYDLVLGRTDDENFRLDRALINTTFVTILVTIGQVVTSLFGGYAFARIEFKGRNAIFMIYLGSIMIPFVVLIVPIYRLMVALGWNDHIVSLIVPWIFTAYGTFLMRQFFLSIPHEIEEAALLDGCSRLRVLWQIFIPLSKPAVATQAIFTFLYSWNSFLWPLVSISTRTEENHVLTLALITLSNINADKPNLIMTGAAVMILPPIIVFIFAQKYFIEGIATSGLKG